MGTNGGGGGAGDDHHSFPAFGVRPRQKPGFPGYILAGALQKKFLALEKFGNVAPLFLSALAKGSQCTLQTVN